MTTYTSDVAVVSTTSHTYSTGIKGWTSVIESGNREIIPRAVVFDRGAKAKITGTISPTVQIWENGQTGFTAQGDLGAVFPTNPRVLPISTLSGSLTHRRHPVTTAVPILHNSIMLGGLKMTHRDDGYVIYSINPDAITVTAYTALLPALSVPAAVGNHNTINLTTTQSASSDPVLLGDNRLTGTIGYKLFAGLGSDTQMRVVE
jgi:hypothetical protein